MSMKPALLTAFAILTSSVVASADVEVKDHREETKKKRPKKAVWDNKGWTYLGEQLVHGKRDHDTIKVGKDAGVFNKITIVVEDSDLQMYDVIVKFGNGESFEPKTKLHFKEDSRTRAIDLPGNARWIEKVEFYYGNLGRRGKARVELWGQHIAETPPIIDRPETTPPPPPPPMWREYGWTLLGERTVKGRRDRDVIQVPAYQGRFDQLTFKASDHDVEVTKITIWFASGKKAVIKDAHFFKEGSRTRTIDLPGNKKRIKKIELRYKNIGRDQHATFQVWGRDTSEGDDPRPRADRGWTSLGEQTVNGKNDRDVIKVGAAEGKFTKLVLRIEGSDLELHDMIVHFGNGDTFEPKLRHHFREGARTQVIDLPGDARTVTKVEFRYSNLGRDGQAKVELFGYEKDKDNRGRAVVKKKVRIKGGARVRVRDHRGD
jgi:hypothetical protein